MTKSLKGRTEYVIVDVDAVASAVEPTLLLGIPISVSCSILSDFSC